MTPTTKVLLYIEVNHKVPGVKAKMGFGEVICLVKKVQDTFKGNLSAIEYGSIGEQYQEVSVRYCVSDLVGNAESKA